MRLLEQLLERANVLYEKKRFFLRCWLVIFTISLGKNRFAEALQHYEKALTISNMSSIYIGKARVLIDLGYHAQASNLLQ